MRETSSMSDDQPMLEEENMLQEDTLLEEDNVLEDDPDDRTMDPTARGNGSKSKSWADIWDYDRYDEGPPDEFASSGRRPP